MSPVTLDLQDSIALITLDDGKANVVNDRLLDALEAALDEAEQTAGAIILAGREGRFSGGFDLKALQAGDPAPLVRRGGAIIRRLYGYKLPVVAAATGHALALGALWLLACDTRIGVSGNFKIGLNETAIGMPLPEFGLIIARERLSTLQLTEAVLQARIYDPTGAQAVGFLDEVVPSGELIETALSRAGKLAKLPMKSYGRMKRDLRRPALEALTAALAT